MSELLFHKVLHNEPLLIYSEDGPMEKKHATHKYKCPVCHKFFTKLSLRCHIRLHTKERPYNCGKCDAAFVRKNNWILHMKNCGKCNSDRGKKIKNTPVGDDTIDKPFLCSTCGARFKKK